MPFASDGRCLGDGQPRVQLPPRSLLRGYWRRAPTLFRSRAPVTRHTCWKTSVRSPSSSALLKSRQSTLLCPNSQSMGTGWVRITCYRLTTPSSWIRNKPADNLIGRFQVRCFDPRSLRTLLGQSLTSRRPDLSPLSHTAFQKPPFCFATSKMSVGSRSIRAAGVPGKCSRIAARPQTLDRRLPCIPFTVSSSLPLSP